MKNKTLLAVVAMFIIITTFIVYASKNKQINSNIDIPDKVPKHIQSVAQQNITLEADSTSPDDTDMPFSNASKNKIVDVDKSKKEPEKKVSLEELAGHTNVYGVRDDIYKYIQQTVPPNNEKAMKAAITYAATSQFIYYKATREEALKLVPKMFLAYTCLRYTNQENEDLTFIARKINKLMSNNADRDEHIYDIDKKYFGWQILGTGLSSMKEEEVCKAGNY